MAQYEEFSIDQGADVTIQLKLANTDLSKKDLTNYFVDAQMRRTVNTSDSDAVDFKTTIVPPPTDGVVNLSLTNAQTDALTSGRYLYDVELYYLDSNSDSIVERILEGIIEVKPSITRS